MSNIYVKRIVAVFASKVGVVGSNCVVIAAEKYNFSHKTICSLDGKVTIGWSGKLYFYISNELVLKGRDTN